MKKLIAGNERGITVYVEIHVGQFLLFDEMQLKILKSVPSGGNRNGNDQKIEKMREIVFFETLEVFK